MGGFTKNGEIYSTKLKFTSKIFKILNFCQSLPTLLDDFVRNIKKVGYHIVTLRDK